MKTITYQSLFFVPVAATQLSHPLTAADYYKPQPQVQRAASPKSAAIAPPTSVVVDPLKRFNANSDAVGDEWVVKRLYLRHAAISFDSTRNTYAKLERFFANSDVVGDEFAAYKRKPTGAISYAYTQLNVFYPTTLPSPAVGGIDFTTDDLVFKRSTKTNALNGRSQFAASKLDPVGWEVQPPQPPNPNPPVKRASGAFGQNIFASFTALPFGWPIQPIQPPRRKPENSGSTFGGDSGVYSAKVNWVSAAPETQPASRARRPRLEFPEYGGDFVILVTNVTPPQVEFDVRVLKQIKKQLSALEGRNIFASFVLQPVGWEIQPPQPPHPRAEKSGSIQFGNTGTHAQFVFTATAVPSGFDPIRFFTNKPNRGAVAGGRSQYLIPGFMPPWGFETWPTYKHPRAEKAGSIQGKEDGITSVFIPTTTPITLYEQTYAQPPRVKWEKSASFNTVVNIEVSYKNFFNLGWPAVLPVVPHYASERKFGASAVGNDGIQAQFVATPSVSLNDDSFLKLTPKTKRGWALYGRNDFASFVLQPVGWEIQPVQPQHPRPEKSGSIQFGNTGTQAQFVFNAPTIVFGYEPTRIYTTRPKRGVVLYGKSQFLIPGPLTVLPETPSIYYKKLNRINATKGKTTAAVYVPFQPYGWEVRPYQPQHPRPERAGSLRSNEDTLSIFVPPVVVSYREFDSGIFKVFPKTKKGFGLYGRNDFASFVLQPVGWAIQPHQPRHPRYTIPLNINDSLTPLVVTPVVSAWGHEFNQTFNPKRTKGPAMSGRSQFLIPEPLVTGWNVLIPVTYKKPHFVSVSKDDDGIEKQYVFNPVVQYPNWETPLPLSYKKPNRIAATKGRASFAIYVQVPPYGWAIQPYQPQHINYARASYLPFVFNPDVGLSNAVIVKNFYEVQFQQPPHPRAERSGAVQPLVNIEARKINFFDYGWPIQPPQPPHPRPERAGSQAIHIDLDARLIPPAAALNFYEVQFQQPPHPRSEKAGSIQPLVTIEGVKINFFDYGWHIQPVQPPHRASEVKYGPFVSHIDLDAVFVPPPIPYSFFEERLPQLPHPRAEKSGSVQPIIVIDAKYENFVQHGWPIQPPQPPHPRREKVATFLPKEDGIQVTFQVWFNEGWEIQPPQPPHPTWEIAGSFMIGDVGHYSTFVFHPSGYDPSRVVYVLSENRTALSVFGGARIVDAVEPGRTV